MHKIGIATQAGSESHWQSKEVHFAATAGVGRARFTQCAESIVTRPKQTGTVVSRTVPRRNKAARQSAASAARRCRRPVWFGGHLPISFGEDPARRSAYCG